MALNGVIVRGDKIGADSNIPVINKLLDLDTGDTIMAEYVWIGGNEGDVRCKTRTLKGVRTTPDQFPDWNYDGSSTNQAPGSDSEVIIKPAAVFKDPFRGGNHVLVLCDTYTPDGVPLPTNARAPAKAAFDVAPSHEPWFGLEQEYTMFSSQGWPLGWPKGGFPAAQGPYYCSAGADVAFGRQVAEAHIRACLYAGVKVAGLNAEVMPGQWEYQVGPCTGIESGDHAWMARYLLQRIGELFNITVSFDPKPIPGDWNGAGMHTNYSTAAMRAEGGFEAILDAIKALEPVHKEHIQVYGSGNERRLTGLHETASMDVFSYGVADRGASIRIPRTTEAEGKGYLEDRRPSSNCDPYIVTAKLFESTVTNNPKAMEWAPAK